MKQFLFLFLISLPFVNQAQLATGTAKSADSKEGLAYASVILQGTESGTLTDDNGYFEISLSEDEKSDSLLIQYIGFEPTTIALKDLESNSTVFLQPRDSEIEEIVVTNIDADSIMVLVRKNYAKNHIVKSGKQDGFMRSTFRNNGEYFQINETAYEVLYSEKDEGSKREVKPIRSRTVIDSTEYRDINEIFNLKKDTLFVEATSFLSIGQTFDSESGVNNRNSKKFTTIYEFVDYSEFDGREAYEIFRRIYRKDVLFSETTYLIDSETYAVLSVSSETKNEEEFNKLIPFVAKAALALLGYKVRFKKMSVVTYYRYNGNIFELDKGSVFLKGDIARGGDWVKGDLQQEYYLQEVEPYVHEEEEKRKWFNSDVVSYFDDDYFDGLFHLPTTAKTIEKIDVINERNESFSGGIISQKHEKWIKKEEKRKEKNRKKKERKGQ